jgi:hypothetical protein
MAIAMIKLIIAPRKVINLSIGIGRYFMRE